MNAQMIYATALEIRKNCGLIDGMTARAGVALWANETAEDYPTAEEVREEALSLARADVDAQIESETTDETAPWIDAARELIKRFATTADTDLAAMGAITYLMDDELRESVHQDYAPCTLQTFVAAYLARHHYKYDENFAIKICN